LAGIFEEFEIVVSIRVIFHKDFKTKFIEPPFFG
jgi:hypothetical protein